MPPGPSTRTTGNDQAAPDPGGTHSTQAHAPTKPGQPKTVTETVKSGDGNDDTGDDKP